ncbi:MAG: T9SS type A sorting domain-containing protein, partial [bacterium]
LIDANDWRIILYTGTTAEYMPMFVSDENLFEEYVTSSKPIVLSAPDWAWEKGIYGDNPTLFFTGDPAYDIFGLAGINSDPVERADSVFIGSSGTITNPFVDDPYVVYYEATNASRWSDYLYPNLGASASTLFQGDTDSEIYGIVNITPWGGYAYYFSFEIGAAAISGDIDLQPTAQLDTLIARIIGQFATSVGDPSGAVRLPHAFDLKPNYPNPFNPATRIVFDVPRTGNVTLEVFNLLGQRVALLHQGILAPGSYTRTFDGSGLASGTYLCRMAAPGYTQVKKLVLVK